MVSDRLPSSVAVQRGRRLDSTQLIVKTSAVTWRQVSQLVKIVRAKCHSWKLGDLLPDAGIALVASHCQRAPPRRGGPLPQTVRRGGAFFSLRLLRPPG